MFKCPHCKKFNTVKAGLRKNKSGFVQKYFCNDCKMYFINRHGFENCQTKSEIIVDALDLRAKGMTLGKIVLHINKKYKMNINRSTVLKWQNKFGEMIDNFTKSFQLSHSSNIHADEIYLKCKGQKKGEHTYYWDAIDYETKFLVTDHISLELNEYEGQKFMHGLKKNILKPPEIIHTDNSYDYPPAIRKTFGRGKVKHQHFPAWKMKFKNNPIERFHNTLRENYKVLRKFCSVKTAMRYLSFFRNYYNFLRPHKTLNWETPAQRAGFGKWGWYSIIRVYINRLFF